MFTEDKNIYLIEVKSEKIIKKITEHPEIWGENNVLIKSGIYEGKTGTILPPRGYANIIGVPQFEKPIYFMNFQLRDAFFINCIFKEGNRLSKENEKDLAHRLRFFNIIFVDCNISNYSVCRNLAKFSLI